jgi:hypothetical protein
VQVIAPLPRGFDTAGALELERPGEPATAIDLPTIRRLHAR